MAPQRELTVAELRGIADRLSELQQYDAPIKRVRWDGTINLGHIVTALTFLVAAFGMWTAARISDAKRDIRISSIEKQQENLSSAMGKLVENQSTMSKSHDRLIWVVETLSKTKKDE